MPSFSCMLFTSLKLHTCYLINPFPFAFLGRYARQVAEFFEFVKKKKEDDPADKFGEAAKSSQPQPQVLLPQKGGLWVPDGKHFPDSALKSLDFRRAMSFMVG